MSELLLGKLFYEHHNHPDGENISELGFHKIGQVLFQGQEQCKCVEIRRSNGLISLHTGYYVGVDWLPGTNHVIYVQPKLNRHHGQTNYLAMLSAIMRHPDTMEHTEDLFEIKFNQPFISIPRERDLLTPLLVLRFLLLLKGIVQKGLKKSYYTRKEDLRGSIKGKVAVSQTIKRNIYKHRPLYTSCVYTEFGINNQENRLLKKALLFAQRFLGQNKLKGFSADTYNRIYCAFEEVSVDISVDEVKHAGNNAFYKEYREAIQLAKLILQRYGYNITNVEHAEMTAIPPFWIDMSKLFELYVLGLLKDRFGNAVKYQYKARGNILDYILSDEQYKMVIDAKYKPWYAKGLDKKDIRQVSGYARLKSVYDYVGKGARELIDCLIIYPDQENGYDDLLSADLCAEQHRLRSYMGIYKVPVKLPEL